MIGRAILVSVGAVGALVALQAPLHAQTAGSNLPVSLARIRAALERPPSLLEAPAWSREIPTFRVEVEHPLWTPGVADEAPSDPTMGLPSAGELLMGGLGKLGSAVANFRRGRAERRAKKEVGEALTAFCAAHACPPAEAGK